LIDRSNFWERQQTKQRSQKGGVRVLGNDFWDFDFFGEANTIKLYRVVALFGSVWLVQLVAL
jgi:hypothetical protein